MLGAATRKQRRPFQIVLLQRKLLQNGKPSAAAARHMEMLPRNGLLRYLRLFGEKNGCGFDFLAVFM